MGGNLKTLNRHDRMQNEGQSPQARRTGAAWGAGSPSAKRSLKHKQAGGGDMGDFGMYMANKVRKLGEQFQADVSTKIPFSDTATVSPKIFEGISIYVNGFTTPSHQELRALMLQNGGSFENYFSKSRVTHIICSNLPDSKINDFRSFSKGLPVLRPEWVVDSIAAGKILPWTSYHLETASVNNANQLKLSSFFRLKKIHGPEEEKVSDTKLDRTIKPCHQNSEIAKGDVSNVEHFSDYISAEADVELENITEEGMLGENDLQLLSANKLLKHHTRHSTLEDANFVKNYFKYSRLHFIGTWRNRYQGRNTQQEGLNLNSVSDKKSIIHIDMDCFFVSVVTRNRPELAGKPVAVCHSDSSKGTGEISSANYEARRYGVKAGMFVRNAKACCPDLEIVPYDFEGYEEVADKLYDILHRYSPSVQAVSCDEAYIDVTGMGDPAKIAASIRHEIFDATKCTASAGISGNILLARLATKKAKPNGQYQINLEQAEQFMADLLVGELPGVGWALREKLHRQKLYTCSDICLLSDEALRKIFGLKTGEMLWNFAHGVDHRNVQFAQERKSIGAEVNWGVRFLSLSDAQHFLVTLSEEVSTRMNKAAVLGRTFTMKVKKRKAGAGEPEKFMGCGICDNISRSATLPLSTNKSDVILRVSRQLFGSLNLDVREVRGVGLQVTRLEPSSSEHLAGVQGQKCLESWIDSSPSKRHLRTPDECKMPEKNDALPTNAAPRSLELPPASEIDPVVLASLPPEVFAELNEAYKGALKLSKLAETAAQASCENDHAGNASYRINTPPIPTLSQVDTSVLAELPTPMRKEILESLPASRKTLPKDNSDAHQELNLWNGLPPVWVKHFQESRSSTLRVFSDLYTRLRNPEHLSDVLVSVDALSEDEQMKCSETEESVHMCSELITQYLQATVSKDLEETSLVTRLIKRMTTKSSFWSAVYNRVLPIAQANILRVYDGFLKL